MMLKGEAELRDLGELTFKLHIVVEWGMAQSVARVMMGSCN
jgi:hypothetical protein